MTQKEFKERCSFHEYGRGQGKKNAIFFDWKTDFDNGVNGFKYMVKGHIQNSTKAELFKEFFNWVINQIEPSYYTQYKYAETDADRFKVPICG